MWFRSFR
ncbi:hypothetical protein LINPERPRIM_LOCUS45269 [Linum perenne]